MNLSPWETLVMLVALWLLVVFAGDVLRGVRDRRDRRREASARPIHNRYWEG